MLVPKVLHRQGFTLVELLVVVGIVTVLIALLMPALSGVRKKAQAVQCGANLHSIGQALTMYVQQYRYFPASDALHSTPPGGYFAIWPTRLRVFLSGNREPFYCPSQDDRCRWEPGAAAPLGGLRADAAWTHFGYEIDELLLPSRHTYFSYGYNHLGTGGTAGIGFAVYAWEPPPEMPRDVSMVEVPASRVRSAANMIAIADTTADGWSDFYIFPGTIPSMNPGAIHNGGANVLFCDGHVQWHPQIDLVFDGKGNQESNMRRYRMWNQTGEPD